MSQIIDMSDEDREFLKSYKYEIEMLAGMVIEMVKDNPSTLFSPVLRSLLIEKADLVRRYNSRLFMPLLVDHLGDPLTLGGGK